MIAQKLEEQEYRESIKYGLLCMKPPTDIKWIKGEKGEGLSIVYSDKEGNKLIRRKDSAKGSLKGSKAWRHNNPGNLAMGPHARQHGAIGHFSKL
jgi:hypothetical protein